MKSISALPNSVDLQRSERRSRIVEAVLVAAFLCAIVGAAAAWCFQNGYILYYGDAQAHLNISRSIIDSRTPGYDQLGTVWLPVLHLLCLAFVGNDWMWRTGLAGTIPVAACFVIGGMFLYFAARNAYGSRISASVALLCFALNPNVLYLATIPMTEIVFFAGLAVLLFALLRFQMTHRLTYVLLGIAASWWMSLTRYDGWFLIPFAGIWFAYATVERRWAVLVLFGGLATFAPLYWMAHNCWETSSALDFYNGPYSAKAIQGSQPYPGYHDWKLALVHYSYAGWICAGADLVLLGGAGVVCAIVKRALMPLSFLMLTPMFYVWSIHSSGTPVNLPQLWPHGYYNSRYGLAVVVLCSFGAGAIALMIPKRWRRLAFILPLFAMAPWFIPFSHQNWICWKESEVNSVSRRAWTSAGAEFFGSHYQSAQGILVASGTGDVAGIFCQARIPLRETLHVGNGPAWIANIARPDLLHQELWAVAQAGDPVARAVEGARGGTYHVIEEIRVPGAPVLRLYRRVDGKER
jgi:hypothetical protein